MLRKTAVALVKSTVSHIISVPSRHPVVVPSRMAAPTRHDDEVTHRHPRTLLTSFVRPRDLHPLPGDLIEFNRDMYSHWGLYVGDGQVIHVRGGQPDADISWTGKANIKLDPLEAVAGGSRVRINNQEDRAAQRNLQPLNVEQLVEQARKLVGTQVHYDLFRKNCEHYVTEWRYGQGWSDQVDSGMKDIRDLAATATREHGPQIMSALQNYVNSRADDMRNRMVGGQERLRGVLSNLLHHDHVRTLAEWPVQQTVAGLAEKLMHMLPKRLTDANMQFDQNEDKKKR